ncbi:hypothetical protein P3G55_22925 [Leptospira sp. 96542]|nr:hypothetical protein [Leptospira sp. 96542]
MIFFSSLGCQSIQHFVFSDKAKGNSSSILYFKTPRKLNTTFFKEGSSHFSFIELETENTEGFAQKLEFSFLVFEPKFLKQLGDGFSLTTYEPYKIIWHKKTGKFISTENKKLVSIQYNSYETGEVYAKNLTSLLTELENRSFSKIKISEFEEFELDGNTATIISEGIRYNSSKVYRWKHNISGINVFSDSTQFQNQSGSVSNLDIKSSFYDYSMLRYEWFQTDPNKLFYKPIYSENKTNVYFVPPFSNNLSSKTKEPFGFKRIGNFLIKEEI